MQPIDLRRENSAVSRVAAVAIVVIILTMVSMGSYLFYNGYFFPSQNKGTVNVLYAGSLVNTMENSIGPEFQSATGYVFQGEGHGSLQDAQMILSGERTPDAFISVGTSALKLLQGQSHPYVSWWLSFATDELVIAFTQKSKFASQLTSAAENKTSWYDVLEQNGFKFGVSDPALDPKGIYVILMFKLAAIYYSNSSLSQYMNSSHVSVFSEETLPSEAQTGAVDAIIAYKHEALEQNLSYIKLPAKINLGDVSLLAYYKQASTVVSGQTYVGGPIVFSITIPSTVKNYNGAVTFTKFILNNTSSRTSLEKHGFDLIIPPIIGGNVSSVPNLA